MLPDRLAAYRNAPFAELMTVLLRQLRRPLAAHGLDLTDADCERIGGEIARCERMTESGEKLRAALNAVIDESAGVLGKWGLTFETSLKTGADTLPGWETTAEFLELASDKANAELRFSTGAALLSASGDPRYLPTLQFLASGEAGEYSDVEQVIAWRVLRFILDGIP